MIALQSCKKEAPVPFKAFYSFTEPVVVAPENGGTIHTTGTSVDLTWESTNADSDPIVADVYFGTSDTPPLYSAGLSALTLNVPVVPGVTYFWHVTMTDANGIKTNGPTWSFTIFEPIGIFVGNFLADEPAESYSYDVAFAKTSANTLEIDNYWNSGWLGTFTLDFTANTYSMPLTQFTAVWSAIESGTIDPATGTMVGHYIVYQNGVNIEEGEHTYTKQ